MFPRRKAAPVENLIFPPDFVWGVSASAFQIEGATDADGRGPSIWDTFTAAQGEIVADDHYHRYPEDVALLAELGIDAYRMSFAWPRIQPNGVGPPNPRGLDSYDRLLDEMCAAGVAPVGTVYHWDTPQALEDAGGWLARDTAQRFAEDAAILGEHFADRARMWIPLNEPMVMSIYGYAIGEYAPGKVLLLDAVATAHHQHLAHGLAVQALRAAGTHSIGTANHHSPVWPAAATEADQAAANWRDALLNRLSADPVLLGSYPEEMTAYLPDGFADDLPVISQPLDFYGVNYYEPQGAAAPGEANPLPCELRPIEGYPRTTTRRSCRTPCVNCLSVSNSDTAKTCHPFTSPKTGAVSTACTIPNASTSSSAISRPSGPRWMRASTCAAISSGPCSTTSSGRRDTRRGPVSSTSTTKPSAARARIPSPRTGSW
jgi:beta-glucosidase